MAGPAVHRLSNIRPELRLADCAGCGLNSPVVHRKARNLWVCRTASAKRSPAAVARRNAAKRSWLASRRLRKFNLDDEAYAELLDGQGGRCAICGNDCATGRELAVDHDHETGHVRGLLCMPCNTAIGLMKDDPERLIAAAAYLTK